MKKIFSTTGPGKKKMHFDFGVLEMQKKIMDFKNEFPWISEMDFHGFRKWIFNFRKWISNFGNGFPIFGNAFPRILEMDFQFLEMHFQFLILDFYEFSRNYIIF